MRKTAMLCVTTLAAVLTAEGLRADDGPTTAPTARQRTIQVVGTGIAKVPADEFFVNILIETKAVPAAESDTTAERLVERARQTIREAGADSTSLHATTAPTTRSAIGGSDPAPIIQERKLELRVTSAKQAEAVVKAFQKTRSPLLNLVGDTEYITPEAWSYSRKFSDDQDAVIEEATRDAIANGRKKAEVIARAAGAKVGKVLSIGLLDQKELSELSTKSLRMSGPITFEMTD